MSGAIDFGRFPARLVAEAMERARLNGWSIAAGGFAFIFDTGEQFCCPMAAAALDAAEFSLVDKHNCGIMEPANVGDVIHLAAYRLRVSESEVEWFALGFDGADLDESAYTERFNKLCGRRGPTPDELGAERAGRFMRAWLDSPTLDDGNGRIELPAARQPRELDTKGGAS